MTRTELLTILNRVSDQQGHPGVLDVEEVADMVEVRDACVVALQKLVKAESDLINLYETHYTTSFVRRKEKEPKGAAK